MPHFNPSKPQVKEIHNAYLAGVCEGLSISAEEADARGRYDIAKTLMAISNKLCENRRPYIESEHCGVFEDLSEFLRSVMTVAERSRGKGYPWPRSIGGENGPARTD